MPIFNVLLVIAVLFFVMLLIKNIFKSYFKKEFCAICAAVSVTWLGLLVLYWLKLFDDPLILALLLGESTIGIFYLVEAKVRKELTIFRLPFLFTLILIGYSLISIPDDLTKAIVLVVVLWLLFAFAYVYRNNSRVSAIVEKIVKCCKRW